MAYTALARKYRSRTFDEVIGQEPIARTLVNAIKAGRIHHGYLFTGTRGSGKTSMARILAKALNCLAADAPTPKPCLECDSCRAIAEGQDIDVIEIDAASNTGIDNIRELRSNSAYRPARSRFKVYIIDEVHMLSTQAFNALLKTLEEPPEHVKFILATTELQKVPATIQSRCQRFIFRNIGLEEIAGRLKEIVAAEGAKGEDAALRRVARLANGSMRDALSITDQMLSLSPKSLTLKLLDEMIPPPQDEALFELLGFAADGDAAKTLARAEEYIAAGRSSDHLCEDMVDVLRALLLVRICGPDAAVVDLPAGARDAAVALAGRFEPSQFVQMIALMEETRRNIRYGASGRALLDAALVRMARMKQWTSIESLLERLGRADPDSEKKKSPLAAASATAPAAAPPPAPPQPATLPPRAAESPDSPRRPAEIYRRTSPASEPQPVSLADPPTGTERTPAQAASRDAGDASHSPDYDSASRGAPAAARRQLSPTELRAIAMKDARVRRVLDLFNGDLTNVTLSPEAGGDESAAAESAEATEAPDGRE